MYLPDFRLIKEKTMFDLWLDRLSKAMGVLGPWVIPLVLPYFQSWWS